MVREAFDVSERFQVPVLLRLATRLSHARAAVKTQSPAGQNPVSKITDKSTWMLLPAFARKNYAALIEKQKDIAAWSAAHPANKLEAKDANETCAGDFAVITAGLGGNYYEENLADLTAQRGGKMPPRLHIGAYPLPLESIHRLCAASEKVLVIEEGQPFIEEKLRGVLPQNLEILGRLGNVPAIPRTGELDPDNVRSALDLAPRQSVKVSGNGNKALDLAVLPGRPPQLCTGCPHADSYEAVKMAVAAIDGRPGHPDVGINSDIGCYSLGAAPPYQVPESIVCMGASVGMAKGASDAGLKYSIAVIGDSTFIHSGITGLIDAAAEDIPMTVIILDNSIVAMTGCQQTMVPSEKLRALILGCGVKPEHLLELEVKKQLVEENSTRLKAEIEHRGLSVVIFKRECLEAFRKRRRK
jgi:indolepyruvate ferredoxin oxidoreductase alpha subunit